MDRKTIKPLEELIDTIRNIDGFPIGDIKDILALSDPPFYTACPNPYIKQFIAEYGKPYDPENDNYEKMPYVGKVSEGKNDPIYNAFSYHTKVPHKAIIKFIKHYTEPGDIVFDGFCGSGMTGIAAQKVNRKAILGDLSPAAILFSYNFNKSYDRNNFIRETNRILEIIQTELGWMYETNHKEISENSKIGRQKKLFANEQRKKRINYTVWSDVFICPYCNNEYIFWDASVEKESHKIKKKYNCLYCNATIKKTECERSTVNFLDYSIGKNISQTKRVPVLINYFVGKERFEKKPDKEDLKLIEKINDMEIPYWFPTDELPEGFNTAQPKKSHGFTHVHHFFTKRNLWILSYINYLINEVKNHRTKNLIKALFQSFLFHTSKLNRKVPGGIGRHLSGTLYLPSLSCEISIFEMFKRKFNNFVKSLFSLKNNINTTCSLTQISKIIPKNTIDYIFIDPPFGANLMYSELSFIWEAWLKIFTNNQKEAIMNETQHKGLSEYTELMTQCFKEMNYILKPNRWITIVFHNSKASVWNGIQESIRRAGFIIAQVSVLDKKQGSFKQVVYTGTVKNDLVINAYKPKKEFLERFLENAGKNMEVDFIAEQLMHIPVQPSIERTEKMLYSKMLAHYIENGFIINYNSTNLSTLLSDNFFELDGYWFLDSQIKEYNIWKSELNLDQLKSITDGQQVLMIIDEKSALIWLYHFLNTPKDYSKIYTAYQQVASISKDKVPEIMELLENNFILKDGKYQRPTNEKERKVVEELSTKDLIRAFNRIVKILNEEGRKIKKIRIEALIYGFTKLYQQGKYNEILEIANHLTNSILQSNVDIMDFVNIARIKTENQA